jgi:hypothetical protein
MRVKQWRRGFWSMGNCGRGRAERRRRDEYDQSSSNASGKIE